MRFIFMDEAGTSGGHDEKCRVVAGIIVHADKQLASVEDALDEALQAVPPEFKDGFVLHAEKIMNNHKYRDHWGITDRANLLASVMAIPKKLGLPIAYGQVWVTAENLHEAINLESHESQHLMCFINCIARADKWIREHAGYNEIATIVAESLDDSKRDNGRLQKILGSIPAILMASSIVLPKGKDMIHDRPLDVAQGYNSQDGVLRVSRIRKTVHFVSKTEDNLVWIADACAYGLKQFFAGQDFGALFGAAICDNNINVGDFKGPGSGGLSWRVPAEI